MSQVVMVVVCGQCGAWQDAPFAIAGSSIWLCDLCGQFAFDIDTRAFAIPDPADARFYDLWLQGFETILGEFDGCPEYHYPVVDVRPVLEPLL